MRLSTLQFIGLFSIVLPIAANVVPAQTQTVTQLANLPQTEGLPAPIKADKSSDSPRSTLVWLALLPLFGGAGVGFLGHLLEKRARGYLQELNRLEERALSQTDTLTAEAQVAIDEIRAYLDRPLYETTIATWTSSEPTRSQLHSNITSARSPKSVNAPPASSDADGKPTAFDCARNPHSSLRATTGRTYLDLDARAGATQDRRAREYCRRGNHLFLEARYTEAIEAYDRAIQLCPSYHQVWCNRGSAFFQLEQYERAIADTDRALALQPNYAEAWNNRGTALAKLKRIPEALISYNKALQLQPKYPDAWINRGLVLMELGQYGEALFAYTKADEYQSGDRDIWFYRGQAFKALGQYSDAIDAFDRAGTLQPEQPKFFYHQATCYALQGNIDLALKNLQQAIILGSDSGFKFEDYRTQAQTEPAFTSLRDDPRFQQLVGHSSLD